MDGKAGARQLVLVGRRQPSDGAAETLAELKAAEPRLFGSGRCFQAAGCNGIAEEIGATMPPLRVSFMPQGLAIYG
jgi:hypothetical protein